MDRSNDLNNCVWDGIELVYSKVQRLKTETVSTHSCPFCGSND